MGSNRYQRRQILAGLSSAAVMAVSPGMAATTGRGAGRPDIIFIMADDLGYADLSSTGSHHIKTPAIDSIGRDGIQLSQGYSSSPVCSPTRTALLTGCYPHRFKAGIEEPIGLDAPRDLGVPLERPTIASVMKTLGYHTKLIGKWHLGNPPLHGPLQHGYDEFLGIVDGAADYFRHHMVVGNREVGMGLARNDSEIGAEGYLTDMFGDEAVKTIEAASDKPLFISLHFTAPHWPWEGREDAEVARMLHNSGHVDGGSLAKYKEMVEAMDQNVAKVLDALDRAGRAENSIVIFTSDNGGERFSETWPFIGQKGELLEGGIRVPILVRWPQQIANGSRSDQVMASMDFLPTLLAMVGGDSARAGAFDGMDLSAQLTGKAAAVERTLFWRFNASGQAAVRQGDWKYLMLGGKEHLFNLVEDSRERAERGKAEPAKLEQLRRLWDNWNAEMLPYRADSDVSNLKERPYADRY